MTRTTGLRPLLVATVAAMMGAAVGNCSSSEPGSAAGGGEGGVTTGGGPSGSGGTIGPAGGTSASGGAADGSIPTTEAGRDSDNQADRSTGSDATADQIGGPDGGGNIPTCVTNDVAGGVNRASVNYIECDVEDQAIDFDVAANYPPPRRPGYDPSSTPVTVTDYGTAFTGFAVQQCHPYCYRANLTVGVDFIAGNDRSLRGEAIFDFPPTVAPIANAVNRASLGWIYVDGPALPAGTTLTAQMVLKSTGQGILLANDTKPVPLKTWVEFKYFPIQTGFTPMDLVNITSIGFRLTLTPAASATDWHGVVYADHFQLRL
jgi:hypothetical protein